MDRHDDSDASGPRSNISQSTDLSVEATRRVNIPTTTESPKPKTIQHGKEKPEDPGVIVKVTAVSSTVSEEAPALQDNSRDRAKLEHRQPPASSLPKASWIRRAKQWIADRHLPISMVTLYMAGLGVAVGHHCYYASHDKKTAEDSEWPLRFGFALAFLTRTCFSWAVQIAYNQYTWLTLRKKSLRISTIDYIFAACQNPTKAFSLELLTRATCLVLLAAICWLLPLCVLASPSTLVVLPSINIAPAQTCNNVASLNFTRENYPEAWSNDDSIGDTEVSFWGWHEESQTWYYDQPSSEIMKISALALALEEPLPAKNPCPIGANCTYSVVFDGPAYKCDQEADFDGTVESSGQSLDDLPPTGQQLYSCSLIEDTNRLDSLGIPVEWLNLTKNDSSYGVFAREWPMWIGYVKNTTKPAASNAPNRTLWPYELERNVLKCTLNHATYNYTFSFLNGRQVVNHSRIDHNGPLLPDGQSMHPSNPVYRQFASYHVLGFLFHRFISNQILQDNVTTWPYSVSDISQTSLVDPQTQLPVADFARALENKFANLVLSLLSDDRLNEHTHVSTACTVSTTVQQWAYRPFWLAMPYGVVAGASLLAVGAGAYAVRRNGGGLDASFGMLLAATRNPEIDDLLQEYSTGAAGLSALPKHVLKKRLRLGGGSRGRVDGGEGVGHVVFGVEH